MSSKRMEDIFGVCSDLKERILSKIDEGHDVTLDDVDKIVRESCRKVAGDDDKKFGTTYDACTRRIDMTAKEFYDSIKEIIAQKGQTLVDQMYKHKVEKEDNDWTIRKRMSDIFNKEFTMPNPYEI